MTLDELKQFMETIRDGAHIVYALIDAEIERQSVTVEDVKDAICAVKQIMNRLVEIDEEYYRISRERLENHMKQLRFSDMWEDEKC